MRYFEHPKHNPRHFGATPREKEMNWGMIIALFAMVGAAVIAPKL